MERWGASVRGTPHSLVSGQRAGAPKVSGRSAGIEGREARGAACGWSVVVSRGCALSRASQCVSLPSRGEWESCAMGWDVSGGMPGRAEAAPRAVQRLSGARAPPRRAGARMGGAREPKPPHAARSPAARRPPGPSAAL